MSKLQLYLFKIIPLLLLVFLLNCSSTPNYLEQSESIFGKVIGISDGDTFTALLDDNSTIKVRLQHIDCPERGQDYSRQAKKQLSDLIFGERVEMIPSPEMYDRYGRLIAEIFVGETNVNKNMVINGLAWHFVRYSPDREDYAELHKMAKNEKLGLWSLPNPIPPWEWRRSKKKN